MFVARWSWKKQYKVFLIDEEYQENAYKIARDVTGYGGNLEVEEVVFESVPHGVDRGKRVYDIAMIMTSEEA